MFYKIAEGFKAPSAICCILKTTGSAGGSKKL